MIRFTSNIHEFQGDIEALIVSTLPKDMAVQAANMARIIVNKTRKYIPAGHRRAPGQRKLSTGRLWSSFGIPNKRTDNPDYDPGDAILEIKKPTPASLKTEVAVGTRVPYALYANYGIGPGQRTAYHFIEKGELESREVVEEYLEDSVTETLGKSRFISAGRRFRSLRQERDVLGRFGKVIQIPD